MSETMPAKSKAEFGIIAGLVSAIVMALVIVVLQNTGLMIVPWFLTLGRLTGGSGLPVNIAIQGLIVHFTFGVIWGGVFAAAFNLYTETKGLAMGGIQLLISVGLLTFIQIPELQGTLFTLTLEDALSIVVSLAIAYIAYGLVLGYVGKKFLQHLRIGAYQTN